MPSNRTTLLRNETDYVHFGPGATGLHHLHNHRPAALAERGSAALALDLPHVRAGAPRGSKTDIAAGRSQHMYGISLLLAVAALWGSYSPVLKVLFSQPTPPSAALITAAQALLAAAFLLACSLRLTPIRGLGLGGLGLGPCLGPCLGFGAATSGSTSTSASSSTTFRPGGGKGGKVVMVGAMTGGGDSGGRGKGATSGHSSSLNLSLGLGLGRVIARLRSALSSRATAAAALWGLMGRRISRSAHGGARADGDGRRLAAALFLQSAVKQPSLTTSLTAGSSGAAGNGEEEPNHPNQQHQQEQQQALESRCGCECVASHHPAGLRPPFSPDDDDDDDDDAIPDAVVATSGSGSGSGKAAAHEGGGGDPTFDIRHRGDEALLLLPHEVAQGPVALSSGGGAGGCCSGHSADDGVLHPEAATVSASTSTSTSSSPVLIIPGGRGPRSPSLLATPLGSLMAVGLELGTYSFCAAALGAWGVERISATKVAFLGQATSLITPLLVALSGQRVALVVWGACCFGVMGAAMVALDGTIGRGAVVSELAGASFGVAALLGKGGPAAAGGGVGWGEGYAGVSRSMRLEASGVGGTGGGGGGGGEAVEAGIGLAAIQQQQQQQHPLHEGRLLTASTSWTRGPLQPALSPESVGVNYVLASCVFYALGTVRLGVHSGRFGPLELAAASAVMYAVLSVLWLLVEVLGTPTGGSSDYAVVALLLRDNVALTLVLWAGFGPGALSSYLQVLGQRIVPAAQAQLLYSTAPLWSALIAGILLRGRDGAMGPLAWLGGSVMLSASLIASLLDAKAGQLGRAGPATVVAAAVTVGHSSNPCVISGASLNRRMEGDVGDHSLSQEDRDRDL